MFTRLSETSQQALKELRLLIYELRPLALLTEGLSGALHNRLALVEQRSGMRTQLLVDHARELPPAMETGLYGIAQEALNNVLKHAHASQVTVRFEVWPDRVELEVSDNGRGFLINPGEPGGGFGLASMRERAAALGGTLAVRSEIERGTSILVSLKWEAPDEGINSSGRE
jgi:signal transduction histidine kinase